MPEMWIVRVQGKEYGPVDLEILQEWKQEGRVLPKNEVRRADVDVWVTAAEIPGLFRASAAPGDTLELQGKGRSFVEICTETFRIYRKGFFQFFCLTLIVVVPSLCAQLMGAVLETSPNGDIDARKLLAAGFGFCVLLLKLGLWPIYIAGIQILTAELEAGRGLGFLRLLNHAARFWTRVAILCVLVYGAYLFWTALPVGLILVILLGTPSLGSIFLVLVLLAFQVWIVGRLFVNFLFWQQFAVLEQSDVANSLQQSKRLARSGREGTPWFQRPLWRGVFIASLWFAFVLALNLGLQWPTLRQYFHDLTVTQDPEALLQALRTSAKPHGLNVLTVAFGLLQALLQPLLGIAFVLLYFDAKSQTTEERRGDYAPASASKM